MYPYFFILGSVNFCEAFRRISEVWVNAKALNLEKCLVYLSSTISRILDFFHWMVFDIFFYGVTVKTIYITTLFVLIAYLYYLRGEGTGNNGELLCCSADIQDGVCCLSLGEGNHTSTACNAVVQKQLETLALLVYR